MAYQRRTCVDNVLAALEVKSHSGGVGGVLSPQLEKFSAVMKEPFPVLAHL